LRLPVFPLLLGLVLALPAGGLRAQEHGHGSPAQGSTGDAAAVGVPPRPQLIPPETPVADVVLASARAAVLQPDQAWPLRPGEPLRLVYPLAVPATEVDLYGWRYSDARKAWRMHAGQDLAAPEGTPVLAMQTLYAHLLDSAVQPGDFLPAASVLGRLGQTGRASGPHLHVELRRRLGDRMMALDPTPLLEQATRLLPVAPPDLQQAQGPAPRTP
jgi:murein DD-endopeptidase MepM/ murein hydrolase activator NlpD